MKFMRCSAFNLALYSTWMECSACFGGICLLRNDDSKPALQGQEGQYPRRSSAGSGNREWLVGSQPPLEHASSPSESEKLFLEIFSIYTTNNSTF